MLGKAHCIPLQDGFGWEGNRKTLIPPPSGDFGTNRAVLSFQIQLKFSPLHWKERGGKKRQETEHLSPFSISLPSAFKCSLECLCGIMFICSECCC